MRLLAAVSGRSRPALLVAAVIAAAPWAGTARAQDVGKARRELLDQADRVASAGPFRPEWASLRTVPVPEWYLDGKLGIFIH